MSIKKTGIIFAHALIGWALCFATIGIGRATISMENTLIIHAILAPTFFVLLSLNYFTKFNYTRPFQTALIFTGFVMTVDFLVVALLILRSMEMFTSLLGTWLPFALIFTSTYLTGWFVTKSFPYHSPVKPNH
jgi:hypothetical protein